MDEAHLTSSEVTDLVLTLLEAAEAIEDGTPTRASLAAEVRAWIDWLYDRTDRGGTD
jgi:hypothetical protein